MRLRAKVRKPKERATQACTWASHSTTHTHTLCICINIYVYICIFVFLAVARPPTQCLCGNMPTYIHVYLHISSTDINFASINACIKIIHFMHGSNKVYMSPHGVTNGRCRFARMWDLNLSLRCICLLLLNHLDSLGLPANLLFPNDSFRLAWQTIDVVFCMYVKLQFTFVYCICFVFPHLSGEGC